MIYGDNQVEYTAVEGYGVNTLDNSIISGGSGDSTIVTEGYQFFWRYDPSNSGNSGFIGHGWVLDVANSPMVAYGLDSLEDIATYFASNNNLNLVFSYWKTNYVDKYEGPAATNPLNIFVDALYSDGATAASGCLSFT